MAFPNMRRHGPDPTEPVFLRSPLIHFNDVPEYVPGRHLWAATGICYLEQVTALAVSAGLHAPMHGPEPYSAQGAACTWCHAHLCASTVMTQCPGPFATRN